MNRIQYGVTQFIGISLAEALIPSHRLRAGTFTLLVAGVAIVFGCMWITAVLRLRKIGWSKSWALLVMGPAALYVFLGLKRLGTIQASTTSLVTVVAALCVATVAYGALTLVLVIKEPRERAA
jgi:hypothetical protein